MKPYESLQEIFDAAYLGMAKQEWQPAFSSGSCEYLTKDGKKCAIGHAIPDARVKDMPFHGSVQALRFNPVLTTISADGEGYRYNGQIDYATDTVYFSDENKLAAHAELKALFANVNVAALEQLQACHDGPAIRETGSFAVAGMIKGKFEKYAELRGLTIPAVV